jgi:hypothetical protein
MRTIPVCTLEITKIHHANNCHNHVTTTQLMYAEHNNSAKFPVIALKCPFINAYMMVKSVRKCK